MNCVSENCKYVGCKVVKNYSYEYFKNVLVFYCKLGKSVSYPFIDDEKKIYCVIVMLKRRVIKWMKM